MSENSESGSSLHGQTLLDRWEHSVKVNPDKHANRDSHGKSYTYAEADKIASHVASYLLDAGVNRGDVVSCQMPGWAEFLPIYIGCLKIGAAISPIPANLRSHELMQMLKRCKSKALFVPRSYRNYTYCGMAEELCAARKNLRAIVAVDKYNEGSALPTLHQIIEDTEPLQDDRSIARPVGDDLAVIIFTSGSEGEAKGVMLSHKNVLAAEMAFSQFFGIGMDDIMFMPAPVAHAIGFHHGVTMPFLVGATCVLQDHFDAAEAIDLINGNKATVTMASTPFLHDIVQQMEQRHERLNSLRFFLCGGSPPNLSRVREAADMGLKVLNVYGATESVPHMGTKPDATEEQIFRQALFPMPGIEVRVVDKEGHEVADGDEGEEISRSDAVFNGYLGMLEATAASYKEGWYHSGDLCRRNPDGSYTITGRLKDIIVRGGENISCLEVETILLSHEHIAEAAVVGMPDERLQERICAYISLKGDRTVLTLEEIRDHFASKNVAKIKYPERLEIMASLPRTHSGKINKTQLAKLLVQKMDS